ncbi:hypothetical protein [uncultured Dokdonia sp.]|uniref:hypothetical protein n=1 Tax=uncultured Dokdonia sp. TaxID=575653 RepID=UPI0026288C70|nr:hypothetical protein [uncultured Dokdonia sp.]
MTRKLLLFGMTILFFACNSPLEKKFNEETAKEDLKEVKEEIDSTDLKLLAGSMIRLKFQDKNLEDMTYGEILENGKKWKEEQDKIEAEQKALAEKAAKEEAERTKRLNEAVMVSCYEKGFTKYDYEDYITYKFVIKNKSDKKIRAVKGGITFTNLFDDKISSLSFVYDQPIEAGKEITWNATTDYNQFKDEDQALKNKDLKDLKVVWKPEKIIFDDGTTLE